MFVGIGSSPPCFVATFTEARSDTVVPNVAMTIPCLSAQFQLSLWCSAAIAEQTWLVPSLVFMSETWMKHTGLSRGLTEPLCMELPQTAVYSANLRELSFAGSWTIFSFCLPGTQIRSSTLGLPIPTISISSSEKRASE